MKKYLSLTLLLGLIVFVINCQEISTRYVDASQFDITGKGFENTEMLYSRLPADRKDVIREDLWSLGLNSAGVAVRFSTNSSKISVKWSLLNNFSMPHMPGTGIRGMDLYTLESGKWHYVGTAQPRGKESEAVFRRNMDGKMRDYMIHLPLYDGVESIEIGIDNNSEIGMPINTSLSSADAKSPYVFYGTSVTQGGCASRPGMAYPAIISRLSDRRSVNLGFSGNARMDIIMADLLSETDAHAYIIDCLPNCTPAIVRDSAISFLTRLLDNKPEIPVYMVSEIEFPYFVTDLKSQQDHLLKNKEWENVYKTLIKKNYKNLYYIDSYSFIGDDGESTVDGTHLTDLGFFRFAEQLIKVLK